MFMRVVHPGLVLKNELEEIGIVSTEFVCQIDVPPNRISQIILENEALPAIPRFGSGIDLIPVRSF